MTARLSIYCSVLFSVCASSAVLLAQERSLMYVPLPDPGYGLFYHDGGESPNVPARWGYHDGWDDGRRDRNHGEVVDDPTSKDHYLTPLGHGAIGSQSRNQYVKQYRVAYLRGYQHGSRL